jgi:putative hemolysin
MKTIALALACALGLAGCQSEAGDTAGRRKPADNLTEKIANADDTQCKSTGLQIGTAAYADCRLRLKSLHVQAASSSQHL